MKKTVIYARYSCDAQTEQSIEGQLRVCQEYAERHNLLVVDTYIDRAMTGTNDKRPDFQRMIKDSAKKQWSYVIVYKLDRFSRDKYASAVHKHTLKQNGVKLVSAMENIPDGPEGIILEALLEGMNQYYSAELSQKVMRGMRETRNKGNFQGGHILYGYKTKDKKVIIDEEQAEIVRYIYEQYAQGVYVRDIISALTERGILYRGKPFAMNTIYGILKNEKYSGSYMLRDEVVDKIYPAIIDPEVFRIVREKTKTNQNGKRSVEVVYLLRQKMKCGYCGHTIIGECGASKKGIRSYYYKCGGRKNLRNGCKLSIFRKEFLENYVIDNILKELNQPEQIDYITKQLVALQEAQRGNNAMLDIYEREKRQNATALQNIMSAVESGIFNATTSQRMKELEDRQQELERLITVEKSRESVTIPASEIRKFYTAALALEPAILIERLIKEIVVFDDEIRIYYNTPLQTSPDESQGFLLISRPSLMPFYIQGIGEIDVKSMTIEIRI